MDERCIVPSLYISYIWHGSGEKVYILTTSRLSVILISDLGVFTVLLWPTLCYQGSEGKIIQGDSLIKRRFFFFCILNTSGKYIFCNSKLYIGTS